MVRVSTLMAGLVLAMTTYGTPLPQGEDLAPPPVDTPSIDPLTLTDPLVDTSAASDTPELENYISPDQPFDAAQVESQSIAMEAACSLDPQDPKTWADSGAELRLIDYLQANGSG